MKGVILEIAPAVRLVDLTHEIAPQGIAEAAFVLYTAYRYFPPDTIHLVVVDPGVGSERRPIAVQTAHGTFVAPDNGVLGYVLEAEQTSQVSKTCEVCLTCEVSEPRYWLPAPSHTFHGRDIFAPVAAHLAAGVPLERFGPAIDDPVRRPFPRPQTLDDGRLLATVVYVDRFGNAITSLRGDQPAGGRPLRDWGRSVQATLAGQTIQGLRGTYSDAPAGALLLLVGSSGLVEIAVSQGNAASRLGVSIGDVATFTIT